jgi:hypothetical protein
MRAAREREALLSKSSPIVALALAGLVSSSTAFALEPSPSLLETGLAPLVFVVPDTLQFRFRRAPTFEIHGALSYRADATGGGARVQIPLWPHEHWSEIDSISLSVGVDVLARFAQSSEPAWQHVQIPLTFQYHVVLHRRVALFVETGATPEVLPGERRPFACWPTIAGGMLVQIGSLGPREFGLPPPWIPPPEARHPRTSVALILRVGFPAGLQLGAMF